MVEWATEIRVRAERRAGEMLAAMPKASGGERGGRAALDGNRSSPSNPAPTLSEIGISKADSSRWQKLAAVPEDQFEQAVAAAKKPRQDALWFALGANAGHGHQLTREDKRHAIILALKTWPEKSASTIADQVGCTQAFVSRIRQDVQVNTSIDLPSRVTGKDGKELPGHPPRGRSSDRSRAAVRPSFEGDQVSRPQPAAPNRGSCSSAGRSEGASRARGSATRGRIAHTCTARLRPGSSSFPSPFSVPPKGHMSNRTSDPPGHLTPPPDGIQ